jgi:Sec-independent protein translocase protein TatA
VIIVFIRPDDLPAFFRKAGRAYAELKKAYDEIAAVKDDFLREMDAGAAVQEAERPPKNRSCAGLGRQAGRGSPG